MADRPVDFEAVSASGDDDGIDVGEDAIPAPLLCIHGCDHRPLADIDDNGEVIEDDDTVARSPGSGGGDGIVEPRKAGLVKVQLSTVDTLLGVTAELKLLAGLLEGLAEACPGLLRGALRLAQTAEA